VLIAMATNLGLGRMSEACGVSYDVLAWTTEWYVREDTLRDANTAIVNHHYNLELSKVFGGGVMSSSDGQRFPLRGKSTTARNMVIHGGQVLSTYTHVSDQWSTHGTKVIVPTAREAHFVLDDFLGNATDLPVAEHATDTHGATLINFALFGKAPHSQDAGPDARHPLSDPVYRRKISRQLNKGESCARCAATCTTPSRAPSPGRTWPSRPSRPGA
jgi:TnpA family transposase